MIYLLQFSFDKHKWENIFNFFDIKLNVYLIIKVVLFHYYRTFQIKDLIRSLSHCETSSV